MALFSREPSEFGKKLERAMVPIASAFHFVLLLFFFAIALMSAMSPGQAGLFIFAALFGILLLLILAGWVLYFMKQYLLSFIAFIPVIILTFPAGALQALIARKAYNKWKGK